MSVVARTVNEVALAEEQFVQVKPVVDCEQGGKCRREH